VKKSIKRLLLLIIALLAWFGLILQLYLIVEVNLKSHSSLVAAIVRYFSFFTILTNLLVAICATAILFFPGSRWGKFFSRPSVQTAIALYILVVGLIYSVALRHVWSPTGLQLVADWVLHDIVPFLSVLYWAFFVPKNSFAWKNAFWWLLYPLLYLVYIMIRGEISHEYPYHFIDKNLLDWSQWTVNVLVIVAVFAVLAFLIVGISRLFYGKQRSL
jgi:hypothetical protein